MFNDAKQQDKIMCLFLVNTNITISWTPLKDSCINTIFIRVIRVGWKLQTTPQITAGHIVLDGDSA